MMARKLFSFFVTISFYKKTEISSKNQLEHTVPSPLFITLPCTKLSTHCTKLVQSYL